MANYTELKNAVADVIKANANEEITGDILQQVLQTIVSTIGLNRTYAGTADRGFNPGIFDQNVFFLCSEPGVYPNFDALEVYKGELCLFWNSSTGWVKVVFYKFYSNINEVMYFQNSTLTIDSNNVFKMHDFAFKTENSFGFIKNDEVQLSSGYDFVVADMSNLTNHVGKLKAGSELYPGVNWWDLTGLKRNHIIIAVKSDTGQYSSVFPTLQSFIDNKTGRIELLENKIEIQQSFIDNKTGRIELLENKIEIQVYKMPNSVFEISPGNILIKSLRFKKGTGFVDCADFNFAITSPFDYIIADCTGSSVVLSKGTKTFPWEEVLLPKDKFVLAEQNDNIWVSKIPTIQSFIDNQKENTPIKIEYIVKKNGTIGVDCDFTDIKMCVKSITDASRYKQYFINVLNGIYDYSNDGENIGIELKNYVFINGQSLDVIIIKRETTFDWGKATIDKVPGNVEFIGIKNCTIISNNCKSPIHIDSDIVEKGVFENLVLINEQPLGTGDNPIDGEANCFALGWRGDDHIILKNIRANGKLWGHNNYGTKSNATFEIIDCNCRTIQIGEINSKGSDNLKIKGCNADVFQLLWFSQLTGVVESDFRNSYNFEFSGNKIENAIIADHAGNYNALEKYYFGKFPFAISEIHKEMNGTGILVGDKVSKVNNSTVKVLENGEIEFGTAVENSDSFNRVLIKYSL
ncbi:hypothetical protein [Elizabethkingia phage TCUEAP2]|nr:hypothetical protein [Elizabethkingia phage TCUEAP2]